MLVRYDIHIHTALSPCADNEMTPNHITGMARVMKLDFLGVTDHCSTKNVRAVLEANAEREENGERKLIIVPGMELTTYEGIHVLCLFYNVDDCEAFGKYVLSKQIPSRSTYGDQLILNLHDEVVGLEMQDLLEISEIKYSDVEETVGRFNGIAVPAHIDRRFAGVLHELGWVGWKGGSVEVRYPEHDLSKKYPELAKYRKLCSSDAHELGMIGMRGATLEIDELSLRCFLNTIKQFPAPSKAE